MATSKVVLFNCPSSTDVKQFVKKGHLIVTLSGKYKIYDKTLKASSRKTGELQASSICIFRYPKGQSFDDNSPCKGTGICRRSTGKRPGLRIGTIFMVG